MGEAGETEEVREEVEAKVEARVKVEVEVEVEVESCHELDIRPGSGPLRRTTSESYCEPFPDDPPAPDEDHAAFWIEDSRL